MLEKNWSFISRRMREFKSYVSETRSARSHYVEKWLIHPEFALLWAIANSNPEREEGRRLAIAFPEYFVEFNPAEKYHFHRHPIPLSVLLAWSNSNEGLAMFQDHRDINSDLYSGVDSEIHITEKSFVYHLEPGEEGEGYAEIYQEHCRSNTKLPKEIQELKVFSTFKFEHKEYLVLSIYEDGEFDVFNAVDAKEIDVEV